MKDKFSLLTLAAALSLVPQAHADFETVNVVNFNAQYKDPEGTATADTFELPPTANQESAQMRFFKKDGGYVFQYEGRELVWANPPAAINDVDSFSVNKLTAKSGKQKLEVTLASFNAVSTGNTQIKTVAASCTENPGQLPVDEKYIDSCTTNSTISVAQILMTDTRAGLLDVDFISQALFGFGLEDGPGPLGSDVNLTNLKVAVKNHAFTMTVTANVGLKANVRMEGNSTYDSQAKQLKIRLDVAKAGILNIKEQIFKSVEDAKKPGVRVARPYIYVDFKKATQAPVVSL